MSLWVLDTDHISLFQRGNSQVIERLSNINSEHRAVTIITVEESLRGWLKTIKDAKTVDNLVKAYADLKETREFFNTIYVLDFDQEAGNYYTELKRQKIRIGTQDLKIASIVLSQQGILVTR
ncbi:MAG: type II toxin-antitoxin system VapC family toxin, partial [Planktothrix sp.]